jgi:enterochelin esterase family protein
MIALRPGALVLLSILAAGAARAQNLPGDEVLSKVLPDDGTWELVAEGLGATDAACADADGHLAFADGAAGGLRRLGRDGGVTVVIPPGPRAPRIVALALGPDRRLYAALAGPRGALVTLQPDGPATTLVPDARATAVAVTKRGHVYFTDPTRGEVRMIDPGARPRRPPRTVARGLAGPNGLALSPDGGTLAVAERDGAHVWAFRVEPNGDLTYGAPWMELRAPVGETRAGGDAMVVDADGRYYVASPVGVQMFDWTGRMGGVIASPPAGPPTSVAFAGPDRGWLYATSGGQVFRRPMKVRGARAPGE